MSQDGYDYTDFIKKLTEITEANLSDEHFGVAEMAKKAGMSQGAQQDWMRLKDLGGLNMDDHFVAEDISNLKGYAELTSMFVDK